MKYMKKAVFLVFVALISFTAVSGQKMLVKYYDNQKNLVKEDTFLLGDFAVIKHGVDGKNAHYFQGKITGLFKEEGTVRVFDYARTSRVMPIVGKKLKLDAILAVERLDQKKAEGREGRAVVGEAAGALGSFIGGTAGNALFLGSAAGKGVSDGLSREKIDNQNITCEIIDN